jgi:hypothetical protein
MEAPSNHEKLDVDFVRKQFPALERGTVCFNNANNSLVYKGAADS